MAADTQVAKYLNRTPWLVHVTGGLHSPLVVSVAPALPTAGLHPRLLRGDCEGKEEGSSQRKVSRGRKTTCKVMMIMDDALRAERYAGWDKREAQAMLKKGATLESIASRVAKEKDRAEAEIGTAGILREPAQPLSLRGRE